MITNKNYNKNVKSFKNSNYPRIKVKNDHRLKPKSEYKAGIKSSSWSRAGLGWRWEGTCPINDASGFFCKVGAEDVAFGSQNMEIGCTFSERVD